MKNEKITVVTADYDDSENPKAVMKSFEDKDFAKQAFKIECERLEKIRADAQTLSDPNDESAAQFDFDYIVDEAVREIHPAYSRSSSSRSSEYVSSSNSTIESG